LSAENIPSAGVNAAWPARSLHGTAWTLLLALAFCMLFPVVLLRGMSLDGITYATIARNMAVGIGDFWHPYYTATLLHPFHEQPPLAFLLEGQFFRVFGDRWWVERLYSVLTAVPTAWMLVLIWRRLLAGTPSWQRFSWLPILFWMVIPSWFWIYRHNYLENTLGMFTALAVYASLQAADKRHWMPVWVIVSALAIAAAVGTKGPVGLFPAATPAIAWLTLRRTSFVRAIGLQSALVASLALLAAAVWSHPAAREFVSAYFERQVLGSLQGARETVDSAWGRYYLVWALAFDLAWTSAAAAVLVAWGRRRDKGLRAENRRLASGQPAMRGPAAFCLLTGLGGSLPIMISPKQSAYYAAPSWPFFCMALAMWCLPSVAGLAQAWTARASFSQTSRWLRAGAIASALLAVVLSPLWYGRALRDARLIQEVDQIAAVAGPRDKIVMGPGVDYEWSLRAYLYRRHYISLEPAGVAGGYRLELAELADTRTPGYVLRDSGLTLFRLYRREDIAVSPPVAPPSR
jgi:hypothetical protein